MPLNYEKIKNEIQKRNYSLKHFIPEFGEMGEKGFRLAVENETIKVSTLQKISRKLNLPMSYWFQEDDQLLMDESAAIYGKTTTELIQDQEKQIRGYVKNEELLHQQIDELREMLHIKKEGTSGL